MRACTRPRVRALFSTLAATAMLAVLMASCSSGGEPTTTGASESTRSTTAPSTTAPDDPKLPGEPLDLGFPKAGDVLSVVGVTHQPNASLVPTRAPIAVDHINAAGQLGALVVPGAVDPEDDHEWGAALSALALFVGLSGHWPLDLHTLPAADNERIVLPCGPTHYFWPEARRRHL